jgi:hypothetical protein
MEEDSRISTVLPGPLFLDNGADSGSRHLSSRQLILPYLQLYVKYFDLGLEYRDALRHYTSPCMCPHMLTTT